NEIRGPWPGWWYSGAVLIGGLANRKMPASQSTPSNLAVAPFPAGGFRWGVAAASTSQDSRPLWMVFLDGTACPDTSQGVSRPEIAGDAGPLHPRLESTLTVRTTAETDSHGQSGFQSAPGWAEPAHADPTSFAPHPSRGPPRSRRAACGLRPARQAESLLET